MEPDREITRSHQQQALQVGQQQERFTNRTVNVVVISITLVAYLPTLLDPDFFRQPPSRMVLQLGLGILYAFLGTIGMRWFEERLGRRPWLIPAYFVVQILVISWLFWLTHGLDHNLWLLILPVSAQSLSLPRWGTAVVCLSLLATIYIIYLQDVPMVDAVQILLQIGAAMLFTVLFTYIAIRESGARFQIQKLATELHEANRRLAEYAAQAEELATTKERNRLAREIHDSLGHYLTVINVQIEAARVVMLQDPEKAEDALNKAQKLTQEGLIAIRQSISALRESPLENRSLPQAIQELAEETQNTGIHTTFLVEGDAQAWDPKVELTLYRVAQEGLTNIRKHAQASTAKIILDYTDTRQLSLTVRDDGQGTAVSGDTGFGLMGIRERVQMLGGNVTVQSAPGEGFTLTATVPESKVLSA